VALASGRMHDDVSRFTSLLLDKNLIRFNSSKDRSHAR
jgi:hypothetical protein